MECGHIVAVRTLYGINSELVILISAGCVVLGRCDVFSNPKPNIQTLKAMRILLF